MLTSESRMAVIVRAIQHRHIVDEIVQKLESDLAAVCGFSLVNSKTPWFQKLARASLYFPKHRHDDLLMVMMGTHRIPLNAADWRATNGIRAAWLFDAWPNDYPDLVHFVLKFQLTHLFVTSKQSADRLAQMIKTCSVEWLPEPLVDLGFVSAPLKHRQIDVIQFGRKHEAYHKGILGGGFNYVYEESKGQLLFPSTNEFLSALGCSKISICFPSRVTHPERSGDVSTMTQRYLQSMASGCLIVGQSPPEMIELFGYNPIVEADLDNPVRQLTQILEKFSEYSPLIERNSQMLEKHTVRARSKPLLRLFDRT